MFPIKFQINWHFGSGKEAKNRFPRWRLRRPYWIFDQNNFILLYTSHPDTSYEVSSRLAFRFRTK